MDQRKLAILGSLVLLLLAGLLQWYTDLSQSSNANGKLPNQLPDSIVYNLDQQSYSSEGNLAYDLQATHAQHFDREAIAKLKKPSVTLFREGTPKWHINAQNGMSAKDGAIIELTGSVHLEQDSISPPPMQFRTQSLRLSPKKKYAETSEPVTIQQGLNTIHAVGMHVDIHAGEVTLLSNVKSRYETKL